MTALYELRTYVAKPDRLSLLQERWERHHHVIYADYHILLAGFLSRLGDAEPDGVSLLLRHQDRRAVDHSMDALIKSNRMNEIPGPPGHTVVDHWERTFLHPLNVAAMPPPEGSMVTGRTGTHLYELRTFLAKEGDLEVLVDRWAPDSSATSNLHEVLGSFVCHPERAPMPVGVSLLLRHRRQLGARGSLEASTESATNELAELRMDDSMTQSQSRFLEPLAFSQLT